MNNVLAAILGLILSESAIATSWSKDPCINLWPENVKAGVVEINYQTDKNCQITNVKFIKSNPDGKFNKLALCYVSLSRPWVLSETFNQEPITLEEYHNLITAQCRNEQKCSANYIDVEMKNSSPIKLACYFDANGNPTGTEISELIDGNVRTSEISGVHEIPDQHRIFHFGQIQGGQTKTHNLHNKRSQSD